MRDVNDMEVRSRWQVVWRRALPKHSRVDSMDGSLDLQTMKKVDSAGIERSHVTGEKSTKANAKVSDIPSQLDPMAEGGTNNTRWKKQVGDDRLGQREPSLELVKERSAPETISIGDPGTLTYRMMFHEDGTVISPWHSISLRLEEEGLLNCICKTPAGSVIPYEVAQEEPFNPLRTAVRPPRRLAKYADSCTWNIGVLPQTLADDDLSEAQVYRSQFAYDNGPLEVVEIGEVVRKRTGSVYPVKPLAAFLVLDGGGCLAWKLVAIATDDPLADLLHNVADLNTVMPDLLTNIRDWLRLRLASQSGALPSSFPLGERPVDVHETGRVVAQAHQAWYRKFGRDVNPLLALRAPSSAVLRRTTSLDQELDCEPVNLFSATPGRLQRHRSGPFPTSAAAHPSPSTPASPSDFARSWSSVRRKTASFTGPVDTRSAPLSWTPPGWLQSAPGTTAPDSSSSKKTSLFGLGKLLSLGLRRPSTSRAGHLSPSNKSGVSSP